MPSILKFPDQRPHCQDALYDMERTDAPGIGATLLITKPECIHDFYTKVYRATLHAGGLGSRDVVCKVASGKHIARVTDEASMYRRLRKLQGDVIPGCFGLFEGQLEEGPAAILVTEYRGKELERSLYSANWKLRCDVINALLKVHHYGVEHRNFTHWNILVDKDQRPFIIDFGEARMHECQHGEVEFGGKAPFLDEFGCCELWCVCSTSDIWTPNSVRYIDGYAPVEYLESPGKLATLAPEGTPEDVALEEARQTIQYYEDHFGEPPLSH